MDRNTVLVTGDFLVDHHIYEGQRHHFGDRERRGVCVKEELGGAALVHRLLKALVGPEVNCHLAVDENQALDSLHACRRGTDGACEQDPFSAYAFWKPTGPPKKKDGSKAESDKDKEFWKVGEAMGFGGGVGGGGACPWPDAADLPPQPGVLVIADGGMGFRSRQNLSRWRFPVEDKALVEVYRNAPPDPVTKKPLPEYAAPAEPGWIVLKVSAPLGEGDLWRELSVNHADRLVVVVSSVELRRANARISSGLSWEQTLEDVHRELAHNPAMRSLARARHLIIAFGSEGALWLGREGDESVTAQFLFDPKCVEGEHRGQTEGEVYGLLSCLTATIAAAVAEKPDDPDFLQSMRRGLKAMGYVRKTGHGRADAPGRGFPAADIAEALRAEFDSKKDVTLYVRKYPSATAACPVRPGWSLLALHEAPGLADRELPLYGIARRVLIQGASTLEAPTLRISGFFTADRGEIEALRSLTQLVNRYRDNPKADKPLSIGIFGPPGAGKSFAVKELAKQLLGERLGWLEFNLSQFNDAGDLIGALHQVRDRILEGKIPVAFFDEFDSQDFKWLKYLLAPMQDGRFQEGQINHPVGRCLFVFAGGTSATFEAFAARGGNPSGDWLPERSETHFRLSKGPDFASRLDGILNVVGPNERAAPGGKGGGPRDIFFPVRRALFIREKLGCGETERLAIHPGLATALLELPSYRHGSRSLTKLLEPLIALRARSTPPSAAPLTLSDLLPSDQLALHVSRGEFDALTRRDEEAAERLGVDELAAKIHEFYREKGRAEGWLKAVHDCEFAALPPFDQDSNRAAARRIPGVLALAGLQAVAGKATSDEMQTAKRMLEFHIDLLAEAEHDGWMDWHYGEGWTQSTKTPPARDDARQVHKLLIPYAKLTETERDKDRNTIRNYCEIVAKAGLKIVPRAPHRNCEN